MKDFIIPEKRKQNQIGRRFSSFFNILMDSGYYEGTQFAKYFDKLNDDGTSKIYVPDSFNQELDNFDRINQNQLKYLVGLTGMGKTTLIRNHYKITDRDIIIDNDRIIIYISFYNSDLLSDCPDLSVKNEVLHYLIRTVKLLFEITKDSITPNEDFWVGFYNFINNNKPVLLSIDYIVPDSMFFDSYILKEDAAGKRHILINLSNKNPLEYHTSLIKYILMLAKKTTKLYFIFDDIESKIEKFHRPIVEVARHIHACFNANKGNSIIIKTLIVLRAYTFRCNVGRQLEARREYVEKDVILKKTTVDLVKIFNKRFEYIEKEEFEKTTQSYKLAKKELEFVIDNIDKIGKQLIYKIANYNLCESMIVFSHIMTNLEWIACGETETNGSFVLDSTNYKITTDNIINAIASISHNQNDGSYSYLPNILYNEEEGTELIGLYVIRFLISNGIDQVYGEKYIEGTELIKEISSIFIKNFDNNSKVSYWKDKILNVLSYLYNVGILFRSVYDLEIPIETQTERNFCESFKLYLSPRGKCLYNILKKNAAILKLYIDDIYSFNKESSSREVTNTTNKFNRIISYIIYFFGIERCNIGNAIPDLSHYQEKIGKEFVTSTILEGFVNNISVYYKELSDVEYNKLNHEAQSIYNEMVNYSNILYEKYNIQFTIADSLHIKYKKKIN